MNKLTRVKGITLIALVITIIVLLILAGITISLTLGENGLLKRAEGAKGEYTKSEIKEELEMDISELYIEKKQNGENVTKQDIADKIGDKTIILNVSDEQIDGEYKDYDFIVDENNKVIVGEKLTGVRPEGIANILTKEEGLEEIEIQVIASIAEGEIVSIEPTNGAELKEDKSSTEKIFKVNDNGTFSFLIVGSNGRKAKVSCTVTNAIQVKKDLLTAIEEITTTKAGGEIKKIKVKAKLDDETEEEAKIYTLNVIRHEGDMVLDGTKTYAGSTLDTTDETNKTYEFGNSEEDTANSERQAQSTVVLKVEGNLIINEGVTLTSVKNKDGYGGPKGMFVYCTGNIINNGTISMTARGANAIGENVYLKRYDWGWHYIPAVGAEGGTGDRASGYNSSASGKPGIDGTGRQTGGGRTRFNV